VYGVNDDDDGTDEKGNPMRGIQCKVPLGDADARMLEGETNKRFPGTIVFEAAPETPAAEGDGSGSDDAVGVVADDAADFPPPLGTAGNWYWITWVCLEGLTFDGKTLAKFFFAKGFGQPCGDLPTSHLPSGLSQALDACMSPLFYRPIARDRQGLRSNQHDAETGESIDGAGSRYMNVASKSKAPIPSLNVEPAGVVAAWCEWHRIHTALCRCVFRDIALTVRLAKDGAAPCVNDDCTHCKSQRDAGKTKAGWGGKAAVKRWAASLQTTTGCRVKFVMENRADGVATVIACWVNRGLVDPLFLQAGLGEDTVLPRTIFKCSTVRAGLAVVYRAWQTLMRVISTADPNTFVATAHEASVQAVALLHIHIQAFGPSRPSPTLRSNAFHFPSHIARYQRRRWLPSRTSNKLVEAAHHWSKLRLATKTQNDFHTDHASVETLRQHGVQSQAEKEAYSAEVAPRLRKRIQRGDFGVRSRHNPLASLQESSSDGGEPALVRATVDALIEEEEEEEEKDAIALQGDDDGLDDEEDKAVEGRSEDGEGGDHDEELALMMEGDSDDDSDQGEW
jgi:hypothetical protein